MRHLAFVVAGIAIGCGARPLDPGADAGRVGVGVDGGAGSEDARNAGPDLRDAVAIDIPIGPELCGNPPRPCIAKPCGNGQLEPFELCDDGNNTSGDGCTALCQIAAGWRCPVVGRRCLPNCGDGLVVGFETCDDGNAVAGDGCSAICVTESATATCGDGLVSGAEECDYGPDDNTAYYGDAGGCTPSCRFAPFCGDGVIDEPEGEQCDLGPNNGASDQPCNATCKFRGDI